jgi:hypothetical protein
MAQVTEAKTDAAERQPPPLRLSCVYCGKPRVALEPRSMDRRALRGKEPKRLVEPDAIDSVRVLSRHAVLNPKEVGRLEINRITAGRDSAVPVADRCDPIIFGHDESLHG